MIYTAKSNMSEIMAMLSSMNTSIAIIQTDIKYMKKKLDTIDERDRIQDKKINDISTEVVTMKSNWKIVTGFATAVASALSFLVNVVVGKIVK